MINGFTFEELKSKLVHNVEKDIGAWEIDLGEGKKMLSFADDYKTAVKYLKKEYEK